MTCLVTSATEDGDSMFLRNVGIDLQIHTTPKPKTSTTTTIAVFTENHKTHKYKIELLTVKVAGTYSYHSGLRG
jgi:hypothetical protein